MNNIRITIFRHAQTQWNEDGKFQGHTDIPLNGTGISQAKQLIEPFRSYDFDLLLTSDLSRAIATAQIATENRYTIQTDARLREANLGEAEGLNREEIEAKFGKKIIQNWKSQSNSYLDICYPGGETGQEVTQRVFLALTDWASQNAFKHIGLCSHGGVIRRIMQKILPQNSQKVPIPNCIVYQIQFETKSQSWKFIPALPWKHTRA